LFNLAVIRLIQFGSPPNEETVIYRRHHMKLQSHRDDVEANDTGDAQVEVLAADDDVNDQPRLAVVGPVRQLT